jgi:Fe-S-cluster containining protein
MTESKKFKGKIRDNPLIALERGNRDVMLNIWREYLVELLELDPKSGRRRILIAQIEQTADFDRLYGEWNDLSTSDRGARWLALVRQAKAALEEVQDSCLRCGDCCVKSSPTLTVNDIYLLQNDIVSWTEIYTLRRGEKGTSPQTGEVVAIESERLKLKEHSGAKHCLFYATNPNRCLIYEQRPEQCRQQLCNRSADEQPAATSGFLTRENIFGQHPELWALISAHDQRCDIDRLEKLLLDLGQKNEAASEALFDMLHFDHYLRQMLLEEWEISPGALDFLLGRPLTQVLRQFGLKANMTPEGIFHLDLLG